MELVRHRRLDLSPLITHRFALDEIEDAYELFGNQQDGVVKVARPPGAVAGRLTAFERRRAG